MRACIWSSGFQADTQALALHLARQEDVTLTVAMPEPARYLAEPVNRIRPLEARILDRAEQGLARALRREGFDLLIVDNHLPDEAVAPSVFVLWHGFGWRIDDVTTMRKELKPLVGDVARPNPRFRWQAIGEWDRDYRIRHSGLAPENVVALGSPYSDLLLPAAERENGGTGERGNGTQTAGHAPSRPDPVVPPLRRSDLVRVAAPAYTLDLSRRTILLGLTWHHGGALAHWGSDAELLGRLFDHAAERGANVLARMHDRHRYDAAYLGAFERAAAGRPHVQVKFKSEHPDSLVDLLLSDVLVSNYSSLLNAWYYTRRPSVHLDPHLPGQQRFVFRRWKRGKLREEQVERADDVWKLDPGEIGGLRAESFDQALAAIDRALTEPECCADLARGFTDRYVTGVDGQSCERTWAYLREWLGK